MKELSIKEKAKAYDKFLEEIKSKFKTFQVIMYDKNDLEKFFPELAEPEDEKIRKELIQFIKNWKDTNNIGRPHDFPTLTRNVEQCDRYIAWLEKQGEQINSSNKEYWRGYREGKQEILDKYAELEKQEWTGEDERLFISALWHIENSVSNGGKDSGEFEIYNWFKSLKDRVLPQQKWSDEDERNASYICAALDCYYRLREDRNNTNGQENLDKAKNWLYNKLKSLRPQAQWKPSDEQMEALESATENCAYSEYQDCLRELIDQLKKLREL